VVTDLPAELLRAPSASFGGSDLLVVAFVSKGEVQSFSNGGEGSRWDRLDPLPTTEPRPLAVSVVHAGAATVLGVVGCPEDRVNVEDDGCAYGCGRGTTGPMWASRS